MKSTNKEKMDNAERVRLEYEAGVEEGDWTTRITVDGTRDGLWSGAETRKAARQSGRFIVLPSQGALPGLSRPRAGYSLHGTVSNATLSESGSRSGKPFSHQSGDWSSPLRWEPVSARTTAGSALPATV